MSRRLANLTLDNVDDLVDGCRECVFWELTPSDRRSVSSAGCASRLGHEIKEAWVRSTLLEWGCCGQLVYVDGVAAGHVLYAPAAYVPRASAFATAPAAADAILLMSAHVDPRYRGGGLGRMLVQGLARDATRRGIRAIEAFGRTGSGADGADDPNIACLAPVDYLLAVGFKTTRPHASTPRLRLDIRSVVSWREDVETAFERLLGSIGASRPAFGHAMETDPSRN